MGVIAIGSGWTNEEEEFASKLQYVPLRTLPSDDCKQIYTFTRNRDTVFCANGTNNRSINRGDSGGAVLNEADNTLIGITSFGHATGCLSGYVQEFTKLLWYSEWIAAVTRIDLPDCQTS